MLRYESVGMRYADGTMALDSVSLRVPRGQFCVILGASGAGKSTLLRMANGLTTPTQGQVWVDDTEVRPSTLAAVRPRIGMVHQHFNLVSRATVATNVLSGALPGLPAWRAYLLRFPAELRERACRLVREVGLQPEHLRRRVSELSGGQQQRVGIARAFMLAPALLLADEPVASLDPRISRDILGLLRDQARERGATVLCSLHQVDLAREFADRIVALRQGAMVFDGPAGAFDETTARALYQAGSSPAPREAAAATPEAGSEPPGQRLAARVRPALLSVGGAR
ncbi:phosphonate ABC transporter ATP-binding protein [Achromobacter denitrificans]|jgi:phosphonate transport system ATP-binding protein|uniref:Phosphonate ABC transporter ATP-binding protein n=2 Tax=Achromobacter denitrificans TaxID=32002 RepID=A0A6N0JRU0_ACHDE|nr:MULTISPECIES: phosphonate ABC transporter ATP-binding protein [Achromobacter]MBV2160761.1 phosphonate ABC transporter ATP-binding protein [Achromobacter denitrificans]MDF3860828.1 phosphonate ABC transporter ATP-binding protein [Achromobacter denitrificans]MDX3880668.1 phosphonate ABC transporter ATP-binding protein [Achromobacter sp.]QKQ49288.1 phosphonate ABC transporter ATP-binding protein [Achromobacter denitrificans]RSE86435.1 phosphonate ABC transporter ATP-binding protein [Achromobac